MKVLMFGWEFPPFNKGGLGTACFGLTKSMAKKNIEVTFIMPQVEGKAGKTHVNLIMADHKVKFQTIDSPIYPYMDESDYANQLNNKSNNNQNKQNNNKQNNKNQNSNKQNNQNNKDLYGKNLYQEVERYAQQGYLIAKENPADVIHAHDWLTYKAGIAAKKALGVPLVCHIHATEFDRTGGNINPHVYHIEKTGFENADKIIAVSKFTKNRVVNQYNIDPNKVEVIHNGVELKTEIMNYKSPLNNTHKIILFLGRITIQKGPDWFLEAAHKVLQHRNDVKFVVAGNGDMHAHMMNRVAELGISDNVLFTGFLRGKDIDKAYQMADLYVMPSVSEPFGITPLEAMRNDTPVLISKQSGVSEVVNHCLKVDFWDTDDMANKMISAIHYSGLKKELQKNGKQEVHTLTWDEPAEKVINVYKKVIS